MVNDHFYKIMRVVLSKYIFNRSHIKLTSYLFSSKFVDFINSNNYLRERYTTVNDAVCFEKPSVAPTISNASGLSCFSCLKDDDYLDFKHSHTPTLLVLMNIRASLHKPRPGSPPLPRFAESFRFFAFFPLIFRCSAFFSFSA